MKTFRRGKTNHRIHAPVPGLDPLLSSVPKDSLSSGLSDDMSDEILPKDPTPTPVIRPKKRGNDAISDLSTPTPTPQKKALTEESREGLWVDLKHGKVKTNWTSDDSPGPTWSWMTHKEFVTFKNAGKRSASHKYTDKDSGKHYFSKDKKTWYSDKEQKTKVDEKSVPVDRLLDRTRKDRTSKSVALYDVSTYEDQKRREVVGDKMEHDHIVAGESIKQRVDKENDEFEIDLPERKDSFNGKGKKKGGDWAYMNAPSIEIRGHKHDEGWDHKNFSSTWGSRQKIDDHVVDEKGKVTHTMRRPQMDAELPGAAFHRDVDTMLTKTHGLKGRKDGLQQVGAYRKLYKNNIKLDNISPKSPAYHIFKGDPLARKKEGGIQWQKDKDGTEQGDVTDTMFRGHIRSKLSKPNKK